MYLSYLAVNVFLQFFLQEFEGVIQMGISEIPTVFR